jgi:hypothetical protein
MSVSLFHFLRGVSLLSPAQNLEAGQATMCFGGFDVLVDRATVGRVDQDESLVLGVGSADEEEEGAASIFPSVRTSGHAHDIGALYLGTKQTCSS